MTIFEFGDVEPGQFPFADQITIKKRPAVGISYSLHTFKNYLHTESAQTSLSC